MSKVDFELIITIVERGHSDAVVESTRKVGAGGGTIIYGRGTGEKEHGSILGVSLQPEKEMIFTLVFSKDKTKTMDAIVEGANLTKEGNGMCFSLPVLNVAGISRLIAEQQEKNNHKK